MQRQIKQIQKNWDSSSLPASHQFPLLSHLWASSTCAEPYTNVNADVVSCPTRWSWHWPLALVDHLVGGGDHNISGRKLFGPLLRAGLVDLDHFFLLQIVNLYMLECCEKIFGKFSKCFAHLIGHFLGQGPFPKVRGMGKGTFPMATQFWKSKAILLPSTTAAKPRVLSQPSPSILTRASQFWKSDCTPPKKYFYAPTKKSPVREWMCHMLFAKKNEERNP